MANILFASNSVSHFPGTTPKNVSALYDSTRVPYTINTPESTQATSPVLNKSSSGETWIHFRYGAEGYQTNKDDNIISVKDDQNDTMLALTFDSIGYEFKIHTTISGNTIVDTALIPMIANQYRTFDVAVINGNNQVTFEVYINELLMMTRTYTVASQYLPDTFIIGGNSNSAGGDYSEFLVADDDTRNARLDLLRPVSAGVYGNWNGNLTSLSDDDPTTGMTTTLADQTQSTVLSAYGGADNISNIVQVTTTVRGINSPDQLSHILRMNAVDYESVDYDIGFSKEFQVTDWDLNPATSQPWSASDIATATEFGFKSKQS